MTALCGDGARPEIRARAENWAPYWSTGTPYIREYCVDDHSTVETVVG